MPVARVDSGIRATAGY